MLTLESWYTPGSVGRCYGYAELISYGEFGDIYANLVILAAIVLSVIYKL